MTTSSAAETSTRPIEAGAPEQPILDIGIPPRPSIVAELQKEMAADDPDIKRLSRLIGQDVALTAALLKLANAPFYGLPRRVESVDQAISMLGLRQINVLVTNVALRNAVKGGGRDLTRFWDASAKRAYALAMLAKSLRGVEVDIAQSFGLFCDIGIPLLMNRFENYAATLALAEREDTRLFTDLEQEAHHTDHAMIGAMMARAWGMSQEACAAIRSHHDHAIFDDPKFPAPVARLVAMGLVAELAISRFAGLDGGPEWAKGGDRALGTLSLSDADLQDWIGDLSDGFATAPGL